LKYAEVRRNGSRASNVFDDHRGLALAGEADSLVAALVHALITMPLELTISEGLDRT